MIRIRTTARGESRRFPFRRSHRQRAKGRSRAGSPISKACGRHWMRPCGRCVRFRIMWAYWSGSNGRRHVRPMAVSEEIRRPKASGLRPERRPEQFQVQPCHRAECFHSANGRLVEVRGRHCRGSSRRSWTRHWPGRSLAIPDPMQARRRPGLARVADRTSWPRRRFQAPEETPESRSQSQIVIHPDSGAGPRLPPPPFPPPPSAGHLLCRGRRRRRRRRLCWLPRRLSHLTSCPSRLRRISLSPSRRMPIRSCSHRQPCSFRGPHHRRPILWRLSRRTPNRVSSPPSRLRPNPNRLGQARRFSEPPRRPPRPFASSSPRRSSFPPPPRKKPWAP